MSRKVGCIGFDHWCSQLVAEEDPGTAQTVEQQVMLLDHTTQVLLMCQHNTDNRSIHFLSNILSNRSISIGLPFKFQVEKI